MPFLDYTGLTRFKNKIIGVLSKALAITSDNNVHPAISQGQFVYVKNTSGVTEGLYSAKNDIQENAAITTSVLYSTPSGGLNTLVGKQAYGQYYSNYIRIVAYHKDTNRSATFGINPAARKMMIVDLDEGGGTHTFDLPSIANNLTTTTEGSVLDARLGPEIATAKNCENLSATAFTAETALISALDAKLATMDANSLAAVKFNFSSATTNFSAKFYHGTLSKGNSDAYGGLLVTCTNDKAAPHIVIGSRNSTNSWGFKKV